MDDIPSGFPRGNGYPPHNPYELNGQFPQLPAYNAFQGPFPPQHPGAPPNAPMAPRNSTSQMPHGAMPPPAAVRRKSSADANRPVRKRITRACDQCNQLRTKCDGQQPCTHCTELGIECQYRREQKKRGKASRKELAERAHKDGPGSGAGSDKATDTSTKKKAKKSEAAAIRLSRQAPHPPPSFAPAARSTPMESIPGTSVLSNSGEPRSFYGEHMPTNGGMYGNEFVPVYDGMQPDESGDASGDFTGSEQSFSTYAGRFSYRQGPPSEALSNGHQMAHAGQPESAPFQGVGKFGEEPVSMEGFASNWQNAIPSSQGPYFPSSFPAATFGQTSLRYPVLEPLVPHLSNIIPVPLACELMEYYFTSASAAHQHPSCPYILGYLYRKQSFFHPTNPRKCKPALLASMLWVAAQNSESIALTSVASARAQACRKLLKLTLDLLKPISQNMPWGVPPSGETMAGGVDIDDLANGMDGNSQTMSVDDIVAHMHIATVMSASERKASSIRWWTLAWSLARELKLSKELPTSGPLSTITVEEREERRRVWWMLYMVDRHLALCYNRPLHFLDTECKSLKLPMDEVNWQQGHFETDSFAESDDEVEPEGRGIEQFQCRGHSVFGYFLPLMFILGNIVNLHHDKSHPTFGEDFHDPSHWNAQTVKITQYLQIFDDSLRSFHKAQRAKMPKGSPELDMDGKERPRTDPQTRAVLTYSTYILHVMHILLAGKWDPIELLDDSEAWISSQAFLTATSHAVSAAESLGEILNLDPSLEFMPFFFGVYLLQGSFLLFLIADRLKSEADPEVIKACQTIIRAHDACVATLNTDYQRNFCKVMRNTLAAARPGYAQDDFTQQVKRRELLAKYRWTGEGTGLAL